jgi:hypothetical protein
MIPGMDRNMLDRFIGLYIIFKIIIIIIIRVHFLVECFMLIDDNARYEKYKT